MRDAGNLVVVVGPSGAGKDTLLRQAAAVFSDHPEFLFARREITRPIDLRREDSIEVSETEFADRFAAGGYALAWRAHGCGYGIPAGIDVELDLGAVVVANVSRGVNTSEEEYAAYRHGIACIMAEMLINVENPISNRHTDLQSYDET